MSKRLQVLLDEEEFDEIRAHARQQRMTVAEWVRQALREARRKQPRERADRKLAVLEEAMTYSFPTADIDEMLDEIAQGHKID